MERKPKVFLGSSSEAKKVMRSLESELNDRGFNPVPWVGSFGLGRDNLSELWRLAHEVDFAVFVWSADSMIEDRGTRTWATRDNVIYEAGLFAGVLSPSRVFVAVEAGPDVRIPSDYSGIAYARYDADGGDVQSAAIAIQKAIERAGREALESDLTRSIEGLWVDAVVSSIERSVVSTFELRWRGPGALDIVNGYSWDPDGEPLARFLSTSSKFDASLNMLRYSWEGTHPREPGVPEFFGVGTLVFDPARLDRATGSFSSSPRLSLDKTTIVSRVCQKAPTDGQALLADNREIRKQEVARLLQWRQNL
jgi:CAP12/Pycsar effector protein, TIR domain